jgi:transposase-like protein
LTPKKWISQLKTGQEMSKKQSSKRSEPQKLFYTEVFKQKIINEVVSGKLTQRQAQMIYGIRGNATILYWIRQSQGLKGYEKKPVQPANFAEVKKDIQHKKLEEENKELKELLRVAELRADLWQHAIEIAEKKFDIDILKKYGAQPSTAFIGKDQKKK